MFEQITKLDEDKMQDKLYDMIKTSLSLGRVENRAELLRNFDKVTKDIELREQKRYAQEVKDKFYVTTNLDDERKRLSSLIVCITDRNNQRNKIKRDYELVAGQTLMGLPEIEYLDKLDEYKSRFNTICSYLDNGDEIATIKKELTFLSNQLEKEIETKRNCELVNAKLEEKLLNNFKNIIAGNKYYTSLSSKDIEAELTKIQADVKEKEEKLNAFILAYESIKNESITSNEQMDEYSSYILDIKNMYYNCAKKLVFLKTYNLVMDIKNTTDEIYNKRVLIKKLLEELTGLKMKLKIDEPNLLFDFYMLVKEQDIKVSNSVDNMKRINQIKEKIEYYNNKVKNLETEQQNDKVTEILKEYGMIETPEIPSFTPFEPSESSEQNLTFEEFSLGNQVANNYDFQIPKELLVNKTKTYSPNAIKDIRDLPVRMNIGLAKKKASIVLIRVGEKLKITKEIVTPVISPRVEEVTPVVNVPQINTVEVNNLPPIIKSEEPVVAVKNESQPETLTMPEIEYSSFWNEEPITNNNTSTNKTSVSNNYYSDEMPILPE